MRTSLLALASVLALGSVAHADDSITASADAPASAATTYVAVGANAGVVDQYLALGGQIEVGRQLPHSPVSLHAAFATGEADELFSTGSGAFQQVRLGADLRGCTASGVLCAFLGTDLGYQHTHWEGEEGSFFAIDDTGSSDTMSVVKDDSRVVGFGRVGLDLGGKHLRWRPGIEVAVDGTGVNNAEITQSVAFRF
jgi:hypothetical protein